MPDLAAVCNHCGVAYRVLGLSELPLCPNCLDEVLVWLSDEDSAEVLIHPPEAYIPFHIDPHALIPQFDRFIDAIPFRPIDLLVSHLLERSQRVFMPIWWVDVGANARWKAEVGFDYEVVSHREQYKGGWVTQELKETRIRWEQRLGKLQRTYENISAPALENDRLFWRRVGQYKLEEQASFAVADLAESLIRIPQRKPEDAWTDAENKLMSVAQSEVQQACDAQHIRGFKWQADYSDQNWTQLLLPVFLTYYIGPDGLRHWVIINGQTGFLSGERRADLNQAMRFSAIIAGIAGLFFVVAFLLFIFMPSLLVNGIALVAVLVTLFSPIPFMRAWLFNRGQKFDTEALS